MLGLWDAIPLFDWDPATRRVTYREYNQLDDIPASLPPPRTPRAKSPQNREHQYNRHQQQSTRANGAAGAPLGDRHGRERQAHPPIRMCTPPALVSCCSLRGLYPTTAYVSTTYQGTNQ